MNRRAVFYLAMVFVLGVALGGVGTYLADEWQVFDWHRKQDYRRGIVEWLSRELALSPEQQNQLQTILEETGKQYERIRAEREQVRQAARQRIRAVLTAEQKPKYEELLRQIDAERRQRSQYRGTPSTANEK